jgi:leucyl aminopeptidase
LPPFYTDDEKLAEAVFQAGAGAADPIWRMPFWTPYESYLKSKVADINHVHDGPFAGSITAALFLKRFVKQAKRYLHLDIFGWVPKSLPGKPAGGEPQGARAIYDVIAKEFGTSRS